MAGMPQLRTYSKRENGDPIAAAFDMSGGEVPLLVNFGLIQMTVFTNFR